MQLSAVSQCECLRLTGDLFPCSGQTDTLGRAHLLISKLLTGGMERWKEIEKEIKGGRREGCDRGREGGNVSADEIVLLCSLTLRPPTLCFCFLCQ